MLAEDGFDPSDDSYSSSDFDPFADIDRLHTVEAASRDNRIALPELVAIVRHYLYNA